MRQGLANAERPPTGAGGREGLNAVPYSQGTVRVMPTEAKNFLQSVGLAAVSLATVA